MKTIMKINIDAMIFGLAMTPKRAFNFARKLEWYRKEAEKLSMHQSGIPQFSIVELEREDELKEKSASAAMNELFAVNRAYKAKSGRMFLTEVISKEEYYDVLDDILDYLTA